MLYNWNKYNVTCQLFLNEKEKNANLAQHLKMSNDNLPYNKLKKFPMTNSKDKDLNQMHGEMCHVHEFKESILSRY